MSRWRDWRHGTPLDSDGVNCRGDSLESLKQSRTKVLPLLQKRGLDNLKEAASNVNQLSENDLQNMKYFNLFQKISGFFKNLLTFQFFCAIISQQAVTNS